MPGGMLMFQECKINRCCGSGLEAINLCVPQGIGADLIATIDTFSRQDLDALVVQSHKRAFDAQQNKKFKSLYLCMIKMVF